MKPEIVYLTPAEPVSMGDAWFDIASVDHFWIRRRMDVLRSLTRDFDWKSMRIAEIGCGSGLLQRQFETTFGVDVDGFDLNEGALRQSVAESSRRFCYNIHSRDQSLRDAYDVIFLFDVIEHIDDHRGFVEAVLFHLKPGGYLAINVPADQKLFSAYDRAAGHVRRYLAEDLIALAKECNLKPDRWTYWGWPLRPLLHIRKRRLEGATDHDKILRDGFSSRTGLVNQGLYLLSQFERIPQHHAGSSLMMLAQKPVAGS